MSSKPLIDNKMRASADFVKDSRILLAVTLAQSRTTSGRESLRVCLDGVGLQEDQPIVSGSILSIWAMGCLQVEKVCVYIYCS